MTGKFLFFDWIFLQRKTRALRVVGPECRLPARVRRGRLSSLLMPSGCYYVECRFLF